MGYANVVLHLRRAIISASPEIDSATSLTFGDGRRFFFAVE
jgi:hypothetical protein